MNMCTKLLCMDRVDVMLFVRDFVPGTVSGHAYCKVYSKKAGCIVRCELHTYANYRFLSLWANANRCINYKG